MARTSLIRVVSTGTLAAGLSLLAAAASAQTFGAMEGRVLDPQGHIVREATVIVSDAANPPKVKTQNVLTDDDGNWEVDSLPIGFYHIEVTKGNMYGKIKDAVQVRPNDLNSTGDLKLTLISKAEMDAANGVASPEADSLKAKNDKARAQQAALKAADDARTAGNFDEAIAKYTEVAGLIPNCSSCYLRIGDIYLDNKKDMDGAEKAYLKAIDIDNAVAALPPAPGATPEDPAVKAGPYEKLAGIYNDEKKFDDAGKMSAKANDLLDASGGGSASSSYNQGVILWNAGKAPEAEAQFSKAVKLDPKMAEAYFLLGMTQINQSKNAAAKASFETYLKLSPKGENADTAKALLDSIK